MEIENRREKPLSRCRVTLVFILIFFYLYLDCVLQSKKISTLRTSLFKLDTNINRKVYKIINKN